MSNGKSQHIFCEIVKIFVELRERSSFVCLPHGIGVADRVVVPQSQRRIK